MAVLDRFHFIVMHPPLCVKVANSGSGRVELYCTGIYIYIGVCKRIGPTHNLMLFNILTLVEAAVSSLLAQFLSLGVAVGNDSLSVSALQSIT